MTTEKITLNDANLDNISGGKLTYQITKATNPKTGNVYYRAIGKGTLGTDEKAPIVTQEVPVALNQLDNFFERCRKSGNSAYFNGKRVV